MNIKIQSIVFAAMMAAVTGYSTTFLTVDFESDTVGQAPVANYVSQTPPDALVTVVDSSTNTAGTGNGVRLYDNTTSTGSRFGYDFSTGESAIRFDISLAQLLDTGAAGKYYSICILANGVSPTTSGNRYTEVRVYDNGDIKYYDNSLTGGTLSDYMTVGTAATLTMYANDSDTAISNYQPGHDLAANSVDFWLDGTYWGTGALLASLSGSTTAGLGRVAVGSGSSDVLMDYVFDDISVSSVVESAVRVSDDYETDTLGAVPANADDISPSSPVSNLAVVVVGGTTNIAGTGNAVRLLDDDTLAGVRLGYDMAGSIADQLSAARVDFSFAALSTTNSDDYIIASFGQYGVAQSSSIYRFMDCRLYADGTIDFRSTLGQSSYNNVLLASNNTLSVFVNDLDDQAIYYVGPDSNTYLLETNSVAYWLNGGLIDFGGAGCTLMEDRSTTNGTIFSSTNNLGRFSFSCASSDWGLDYVIDDLEVQTLEILLEPPTDAPLLSEDYEAETLGTAPAIHADDVSPTTPTADLAVEVVGGTTNIAGTGNAVRLLDNNTGSSLRLAYDLVDAASNQLSAARVDFSFAALTNTASGDYFAVAVGEYGVSQSSSVYRFLNCRLQADGTIDFVSTLGPDSYNNVLLASNNTLSIFVNDLDDVVIGYTGPDDAVHALGTNSVAYWLNGSLIDFGGAEYTLMENQTTANGTVFNSTNNLGRFGFACASSDYGLDYVVDDLEITTLALDTYVAPVVPDYLLYESFEDQTVGAQPTGVAYLRPTSNTSSNLVEVVNSSVNTTGPGNGVRYLDDDSVNSGAMVWNFVADSGSQISAVRVDMNLAPLAITDSSNDLRIAVGTYGNTLASHGTRYINCRVYSTGKIGFDPNIDGIDTGITNAVDLSSSSNALTLIINDYDAETVTYTGLDDATYVLPANSVAYWLNGTLQTFDGAEYTSMDTGDTTTGGTVGTTTNNLGSFGLVSASTFVGLDYLFDEILITTNGLAINPAAADPYADWAATNGVTGAAGDDDDSDGLSNFGEYVFDGNPEAVGDLGTQPLFSAGNYIFSLRADSNLSYTILTNADLVNGIWGTNAGPVAVTVDDGAMDAYTNSIGTTAGQLFIRLIVE